MLLGRAGWGGRKVPVWTIRCPAQRQEQNGSKSPSALSGCAGGVPGGRRCGRTDGQAPRAAWGCTGLVCGWYKRGDAEKLGLGGSRCGSGSGRGGQKDGCGLRILSALSVGRAAGGRTGAGSTHGQHGLEAADPAGQTDGRRTERPAWLRTDRRTDVGLVVGNTDRSSERGQSGRTGTRSIRTDGWMQAQHFGCPTCGAGRRRTDGLELLARMPSTRPGRRCGRQTDGRTDGRTQAGRLKRPARGSGRRCSRWPGGGSQSWRASCPAAGWAAASAARRRPC